MPRPRLLLPATLLALAVPTASVSAQDFCVNSVPNCTGTDITSIALQSWLDTAAGNGTADRFFFGPGTIVNGPFSYTSNEPVQLIGAGEGATILTSDQPQQATLTLGGPDAEVSGMTIKGLTQTPGALRLAGARASHVAAQSSGAGGMGPIAVSDGARLDHVDATGGQTWGIGVLSGDAEIADSHASSNAYAGVFTQGGAVTLTRDRLAGPAGVAVGRGVTTVRDSLIDTRGASGSPVAGVMVAPTAAIDAKAVVDRSTVLGDRPGAADHFGLYVTATNAGQHGTLVATNTVVSGFGVPVARHGSASAPADLTASYDAYGAGVLSPNEDGPGRLTEDHVVGGAPRFTDLAGGDLTPAPDSPLLDAGSDEPLDAGAIDLAGAARRTDGDGDCRAVLDIGAFERPSEGAACAGTATPAGAPAPAPGPAAGGVAGGLPIGVTGPATGPLPPASRPASPAALRISGLKVAPGHIHRGRAADVLFTLTGDRATVTIKVMNKRHRTVLRRTLTRSGTLARHLALKPGRYTVTATATGAGGARSNPATARFTVVR